MKKNVLIFLFILLYFGQLFSQVNITGKVVDESGDPVPGVNVTVEGTNTGNITDIDGNYSIGNVSESDILIFSFVGMVTQKIEVGNQTVINVTLQEEMQSLDEVIVIGYGEVKRRDLTGSISSVKGDEIIDVPTSNTLEALQGKVSGVDIVRESGRPGSGVYIRVRGNNSLGRIDDESSFDNVNEPLIVIDGVQGGSLSDINMNDIVSVEILKDASTTAIYGYQGGGGVILITTKRGKAGKTKVSYNGYYGINGFTEYPKANLKEDYVNLRREASRTTGNWDSPEDDINIFTVAEWDAIQNDQWIDWADEIFENQRIQDHHFSISGGSEKTTSYFSAGYYNEEGNLNDDYTRYSLRLKLDHNLNNWLFGGVVTQITHTISNSSGNAYDLIYKTLPFGEVYEDDGQIKIFPMDDPNYVNPLTDLRPNASINNSINTSIYTNGYLEIKPIQDLSLKTVFGTNLNFTRKGEFDDEYSTSQINQGYNTTSVTASPHLNYNWDNILTYNRKIERHSFTLTALTSYTFSEREAYYASGDNQEFSSPLFYQLQGTELDSWNIYSEYIQKKTFSYAGRIHYNYNDIFLFTSSVRTDAASMLSSGYRSETFPSFAIAIRPIEYFKESLAFMSNLKIRYSRGTTGNSSITPYGTQSVVEPATNMSFGEVPAPAYSFGTTLNSNKMTWEKSTTADFGIDLGFFNQRLTITADKYLINTDGILYNRNLPVSLGGQISSNNTFTIWQNVGKSRNEGFELEINAMAVKTRDFSWRTSLSYSQNKEKLVDLIDGEDITSNPGFPLLMGKPLRSFWDYKKTGIWQEADSALMDYFYQNDFEPGDIKVQDVNNDTLINEEDRTYIGSHTPKWIAGWQNTFTYKSFDLGINMVIRWGHVMYNDLLSKFTPDGTRNSPAFIEYWTPENPTNDFPRPVRGLSNWSQYSSLSNSLFYVDASYFKVKTISLGYTIPQEYANKIHVQRFRLYCTASNLITITKSHLLENYDPENGGSVNAPMSKQVIFGVNVDF